MTERLPKLLKFESPDEFMKRDGWRDDVDVRATPPVKIIGGYDFPKALHLPCGLASCHTKHGLGFVVLLSDDTETHVGRYCGRRHVDGAIWEDLYSKFELQRRAEKQMDVLERVFDQRQTTLGLAYDLYARCELAGAPVTQLFMHIYRDKAVGRAWEDVCRQSGRMTYTRLPTEAERQLNPSIRYVPISVGRIEGFAIRRWENVAGDLQTKAIDHLEALGAEKLMQLNAKELERYSRFIAETQGALRQAKYFLKDSEKFLRVSNWMAFENYCRDSGVRFASDPAETFRLLRETAENADRSWLDGGLVK